MITLQEITKTNFNERDVEVPAFIKFIKTSTQLVPRCSSLLDVGAHYSYATYASDVKQLMSSGRYVACDILDDPNTARIVDEYLIGNVTDLELPTFDIVSCISVIEHCGITTYKKTNIELEQMSVFKRMADLAQRGLYLTFPYGLPGVFPGQYSNITANMIDEFCNYWKTNKGPDAIIDLQFFYNEFSPQGKPWIELTKEEASKIPLRVDLGLVQCVCIFEARC